MKNDLILNNQFEDCLKANRPFLDVRSEGEFDQAHLEGATMGPLLNNEERAIVGTTYKLKGSQKAVELGYQIVRGQNKENKIKKWALWVRANPEGVIYCARGGLRSQISQGWIKDELGIEVPRLEGGYKAFRSFLADRSLEIIQKLPILILSGPTGSGKTKLIKQGALKNKCFLDLEAYAQHRGSAFGSLYLKPVTAAQFEVTLNTAIIQAQLSGCKYILLEDESRTIGPSVLSGPLYEKMKSAKVFYLNTSFETRIDNIFEDYIGPITNANQTEMNLAFNVLRESLNKISRKLGGVQFKKINDELNQACHESVFSGQHGYHKNWINSLLSSYYDPLYNNSFNRNHADELIEKGLDEDFFDWINKNNQE